MIKGTNINAVSYVKTMVYVK